MKVYFDNASTTKIMPEVLEYMIETFSFFANSSSVHSEGQKSRAELENARNTIANFFDVRSKDIVFTSGATEANNIAIQGMVEKSTKKHIITSKIEHASVLNVFYELEKNGYEVSYINVKEDGIIDLEELKNAITDETSFISIMAVNNETGVKQPLKEISNLIKGRDILFHTDAVQLIGKEEFKPNELGIDSFSASGHKFYGPKGVGILYIKDEIAIKKCYFGGKQERNKRPGTENLQAILAMTKALEIMYENMEENNKKSKELSEYLKQKLESEFTKIKFNVNHDEKIDEIINISIEGIDNQMFLPILDMNGIYISAGSACMSGSLEPSYVLEAMNKSKEVLNSSIRISLGIYNEKNEIDYFIEKLKLILK